MALPTCHTYTQSIEYYLHMRHGGSAELAPPVALRRLRPVREKEKRKAIFQCSQLHHCPRRVGAARQDLRAPYCVQIAAQSNNFWQSYPPFCTRQLLSRPSPAGTTVGHCIKIHLYSFQDHFDSFKTILYLVYLQRNGRTAHFPAAHIPLAL